MHLTLAESHSFRSSWGENHQKIPSTCHLRILIPQCKHHVPSTAGTVFFYNTHLSKVVNVLCSEYLLTPQSKIKEYDRYCCLYWDWNRFVKVRLRMWISFELPQLRIKSTMCKLTLSIFACRSYLPAFKAQDSFSYCSTVRPVWFLKELYLQFVTVQLRTIYQLLEIIVSLNYFKLCSRHISSFPVYFPE